MFGRPRGATALSVKDVVRKTGTTVALRKYGGSSSSSSSSSNNSNNNNTNSNNGNADGTDDVSAAALDVARSLYLRPPVSSSGGGGGALGFLGGGGGGNNNGSGVSLEAYCKFWSELTVERITELVEELVAKMLELDKLDRNTGRKTVWVRKSQAQYGLVCTLEYIHLFLSVDFGSKRFEKARAMCDAAQLLRASHPTMERLSKIMKNLSARRDGTLKHLINFAVTDACYVVEGQADSVAEDFAFMFCYLRFVLQNYDQAKAGIEMYTIYHANLDGLLRAWEAGQRPSALVPTITNMVFLLGELVALWPPSKQAEHTILGRVVDMIKVTVLRWAQPYAGFAAHVVEQVSSDLAQPGHLARAKERRVRDQEVLVVFDDYLAGARLVGEIFTAFSEQQRQEHQHQSAADHAPTDQLETRTRVEPLSVGFGSALDSRESSLGVAILGGNAALQRYAAALDAGCRNPVVFVVPCALERCDVSSCIALQDPWYKKHVYAPFVATLGYCPPVDYVGFSSLNSSNASAATVAAAVPPTDGTVSPARMLYTILSDYLQTARQTVPVTVFRVAVNQLGRAGQLEYLDSSVAGPAVQGSAADRPCDMLYFVASCALGLNSAVSRYSTVSDPNHRDRSWSGASTGSTASGASSSVVSSSQPVTSNPSSTLSSSTAVSTASPGTTVVVVNSLGEKEVHLCSPWEEVLLDKAFVKSGPGPGLTPEVKMSLHTVELDGSPSTKTTELSPAEYLFLTLSSCPAFAPTSPEQTRIVPMPFQKPSTKRPWQPWLEVAWVQARTASPALMELAKKRDKRMKDVEAFADLLRAEQKRAFASKIVLTATSERNPFYLTLDDSSNAGPFLQVTLEPTPHTIPVATFVPIS